MQPSRSASLSLRLLLALAMVTWGGAWPAGKVASTAAPPEVTILWRFILTTAAFLPVFLAMRRAAPQAVRFRSMPARAWAYTVATAAGMVLYNLLFLFGVRRGLAGVGGIVTPMVGALITGLATMALRRRRPASSMVAGLVLGLAGGLVILRVWRFSAGELLGSGNLYFLAAAATWSTVTFCSQRAQQSSHFATHSFAAYALAALIALPFAAGGDLLPPAEGWSFWLLVAYLGIAATDFATTTFFLSTSRLGTGQASSFLFIVPTAAVLLSWLLLGERPDAATLLGGALSIAAVYLVNAPAPAPAPGPAPRRTGT